MNLKYKTTMKYFFKNTGQLMTFELDEFFENSIMMMTLLYFFGKSYFLLMSIIDR